MRVETDALGVRLQEFLKHPLLNTVIDVSFTRPEDKRASDRSRRHFDNGALRGL